MTTSNHKLAVTALAAVCIIWGTTYLALRVAVADFPPFLFTAIRQTTAGLLLLAFVFIKGGSLPNRAGLISQAVAGFFMISIGNGFVAWGEMHIPSGVAAIICSLMPVVVILINLVASRDERPTLPIVFGVILGLIGIVLIFSEHFGSFGNTAYIAGIVLTFLAVLGWAGGSIWIKKKNTGTNLFINAGLQMFFGGLWCFPLSLLFDDLNHVTWTTNATLAMAYLIVFGSVIAYAAYSYALRNLPMTIVSLYAYVNPLVAVLLGWLILDETLNLQIILAFLLTLAGIYIVNRGYQLRNEWRAQLRQTR